jgi:chromosome segregation ATPase
LIQLIRELENKIITLEKELADTESMVQKETGLRVELEAEIRRLNDKIRLLESLNNNSGNVDLKYQAEIQSLTTKINDLLRQIDSLKSRINSYELKI